MGCDGGGGGGGAFVVIKVSEMLEPQGDGDPL